MIAALAPRDSRGEALAGLYFVAYLGLIIPTLGMGILTQYLGAPQAILWFAGALLIVLAASAVLQASPDAAQRAEQAREQRHHGQQRLSQYEREVPKPPIEDELGH